MKRVLLAAALLAMVFPGLLRAQSGQGSIGLALHGRALSYSHHSQEDIRLTGVTVFGSYAFNDKLALRGGYYLRGEDGNLLTRDRGLEGALLAGVNLLRQGFSGYAGLGYYSEYVTGAEQSFSGPQLLVGVGIGRVESVWTLGWPLAPQPITPAGWKPAVTPAERRPPARPVSVYRTGSSHSLTPLASPLDINVRAVCKGMGSSAMPCRPAVMPKPWRYDSRCARKDVVMATDLEPIEGNWYYEPDKERRFEVIATDEQDNRIDIQDFDGDLDEITYDLWFTLDLELAEAPEEWSGSIDNLDEDDLGYQDAAAGASKEPSAMERYRREQVEWAGKAHRPDQVNGERRRQPRSPR